ncbi:hypothetical protein GQ457_16G008350 [Hibiscus cannabinus]
MIAFHEYPLTMVEHYWFRRVMKIACPMFKEYTRNTAKNDNFKVYENEKKKMINTLQNNDSKIAITTDMWTSAHQKKGFMTITTHFIDDSWILQSRIIRFTYVLCPHAAELICDVLSESLMDWNIDNNIFALALDNCSTNDKMMKLICGKLTLNSLWLDGNLLHVRCSAHILNLIVKDDLEIIKSFIDNVRDSVTFWIATPKTIEKFQGTACQLNIPVTTKIALDCSTRWNSTYHMLNVTLSYKEVFKRLKKRDNIFFIMSI